ncbi:MAG: DUF1028 domain-containing protein [Chloroflexi bacterium]|nr:DUF1028 domain-containing protein [Chloroflexota bacterium]
MHPSTFSLVAYDSKTGDLGIAVESKFLSVGAVVPWAQAGIGAIATQSFANTAYGPRGLRMLKRGMAPKQAGAALIAQDKDRDARQFGIVDARGRAFSYTGKGCYDWAGGRIGKNYAAQGNILAGAAVVAALAETFEKTGGELADRLVAALVAGQAAGGDKRGQESAALLVVRKKGGYAGFNDRYIDLRVDDHPAPIEELKRILELHRLYLGKTRPADILPIDYDIARELQVMMGLRGYYRGGVNGKWDEETRRAFREFAGVENLEDRWLDGARIDRVVLEFLRKRFQL